MEKKHFLLKLIPPRPTFAFDMNEEEKKLMGEHVVYWQDMMEKGYVIVFGPVLEPKGAWGLGIMEAENEEQIRTLMASDPSIKSGLNKLEIFPMRAIIKEK